MSATTMQHLWEAFGTPIRRFVGSRIRDAHAADDVTQEVMLKVQTHLDALPPEEKLPAWVYEIARNAVIDYYRSRRPQGDVAEVDAAEPAPDAHRQAVEEMAGCLREIVERLPEPYREALKLADLDGLSQQDVADRTGLSLSGAKSRIQRARQMLKEMIVDCCRVEVDAAGRLVDYQTTERTPRYCGVPGDTGPCGG